MKTTPGKHNDKKWTKTNESAMLFMAPAGNGGERRISQTIRGVRIA